MLKCQTFDLGNSNGFICMHIASDLKYVHVQTCFENFS